VPSAALVLRHTVCAYYFAVMKFIDCTKVQLRRVFSALDYGP
jgi:hypothetical protein